MHSILSIERIKREKQSCENEKERAVSTAQSSSSHLQLITNWHFDACYWPRKRHIFFSIDSKFCFSFVGYV